MGCSNARLLVQTSANETNPTNLQTTDPFGRGRPSAAVASNDVPLSDDPHQSTTRMHLTGVDLVVERNGSYTLLLTPKTHKQLMPYVLRKKRFRILVDKARAERTLANPTALFSYDSTAPERLMQSENESKLNSTKLTKSTASAMDSTLESVQQVAKEELDKAKARFIAGRSIDRGDPEDDQGLIHSDDEGMIEEIITTVEEDKDLECKVKKKIETKKTVAEDPETHNKITKVVKTEVTEITRTITINDEHDLERAKRELGIDDVNKFLPSGQMIYNLPSSYQTSSSAWIDHPRLTHVQEKFYEPANEIVTSGDFPSDSPVKQHSPAADTSTDRIKSEASLADATTVGRGAVVETISPSTIVTEESKETTISKAEEVPKTKEIEKKNKTKKKSSLSLCSCTRSQTNDHDEEERKQKTATIIEKKSKEKKKAASQVQTPSIPVTSAEPTPSFVSAELHQLIKDKKSLIRDYLHRKVFLPSKLFSNAEQEEYGRKISEEILDQLETTESASSDEFFDQIKTKHSEEFASNAVFRPILRSYHELFTTKQSNLINTFSTIHHANDIENLPENSDYISIVQTYLNEEEKSSTAVLENGENRADDHVQSAEKVIDDRQDQQQAALLLSKPIDMSDHIEKDLPFYNEEQLNKMLANISQDKPITLAEAIAYQYIDLDDPKLALPTETIQSLKNLFRPMSLDDESALNVIRVKRSGQPLTDFNLAESHSFEKFHLSEPLIYQLQQSFEPTLDFNEKQFRSLAEAVRNHRKEYLDLQFDIGRTLVPAGDMKESSTNDFSQSDSGYSMTTTTHESLASKLKNEFETITEPITDQSDQPLDSSNSFPQTDSNDLRTESKMINDLTPSSPLKETKENTSIDTAVATTTTVSKQKRKSSGLFSCFGNKNSKAAREQQGQPTIVSSNAQAVNEKNPSGEIDKVATTTSSNDEKVPIDYAILPDGRRIYIDTFRDRPGLDMTYQPDETRFALPIVPSSSSDPERAATPETLPAPAIHLESRSTTFDSTDLHPESLEEKVIESPVHVQSETVESKTPIPSDSSEVKIETVEVSEPIVEPVDVQHDVKHTEPVVHLEARQPTIEPVDVQAESTPVAVVLPAKQEESVVSKALENLHAASVDLPEVQLVQPGPLPTLTLSSKEKTKKTKEVAAPAEKPVKTKRSSVGLCASCFGAKAAEKKKKEKTSDTAPAPIEPAKVKEEAEVVVPVPAAAAPVETTIEINESPLTAVVPLVKNEETVVSSTPVQDEPKEPEVAAATTNTTAQIEEVVHELPKLEDRLDATIEKLVMVEEPHYQLPSSEPVPPVVIENEYSLPDANTYDIPRSLETTNVQETPVVAATAAPEEHDQTTKDVTVSPVSSAEVIPSKEVDDKPQIESIMITSSTTNETMPNVDVNENSSKGSYTLPTEKSKKKKKEKEEKVKKEKGKKEKKSGFFASVFRHSDRKSKSPALDLPSVERDLTPNNQPADVQISSIDPLHVPNTDLPKPDIQLPEFDRPEVNAATGQTNDQTLEFAVPAVNLPPIPNLELPVEEKKPHDSNNDSIKVPSLDLPEVQFTSHEQEPLTLPEIHLKSSKETPLEQTVVAPVEEDKVPELPVLPPTESVSTAVADLVSATPLNDTPNLQVNDQESPLQTDSIVKNEPVIPELPQISPDESNLVVQPEYLSTEQKYTITDTHFVTPPELPLVIEKPTNEHIESVKIELPSVEGTTTHSEEQIPSVDNGATAISAEISPAAVKTTEKQPIESKSVVKKKSSTLALCSCFGSKSSEGKTKDKAKTKTLTATKTDLPPVEMSAPAPNISSTLKETDPLRAPAVDLPPVQFNAQASEPIRLPSLPSFEKKRQAPKKPETVPTAPVVPTIEVKTEEEMLVTPSPMPVESTEDATELNNASSPTPILDVQTETVPIVRSATPPPVIETPAVEDAPVQSISSEVKTETETTPEMKETAKSSSSEMRIAELDQSIPVKSEGTIQSRSDSGLEAIISSHLQSSSTFGTTQTIEDLQEPPSISSGLGSEVTASVQSKGPTTVEEKSSDLPKRENSFSRHDFAKKITLTDESRTKLIFRQEDLKKCLESEIAQSIDDFDAKRDQKQLNKILTHGIDLIKDKKVATYPELKQKLIVEHKHEAFIVDPVVRSLYCTMENQGLDNIDKPEFALAIRDMVRLPAKQTYDTVTQLNKSSTDDAPVQSTSRSWLCGRSKTKKPKKQPSTTPKTTQSGLLDERRRLQLNVHRQELGNILRDHIQSASPAIRHFPEHPREVEKILRKTLASVTQPKVLSYEQIRNDLKTEYKLTYYLVDPIVDVVRDTFDHCDITQMNEKTNLDILDANIAQTAQLYNQVTEQHHLLTAEELNHLKNNQLTWLNQYLLNQELKEKKINSKQNKELLKILPRAWNILSLNLLYTWDDLNAQLRREFPKAHDLCDRAVEMIRKGQKNGLLVLTQSPDTAEEDVTAINIIQPNGKRRASSLITERAKANLKNHRTKIVASITALLYEHHKPLYTENQIQTYVNKALHHLEEQKPGQFKDYNDLKNKLKKDFKSNHETLLEQIVDVIEQAHATNQFDDIEKAEVQTLMKDRLEGKPLVIKEMYVSLPPRVGAYGTTKNSTDESARNLSTSINGDQTLNSSSSSHRVARGLSWREANERARILFYRGKHPAIHYDEQAAGFDVRMLLETTTGGTQEIPVTDSDVHELLNSCGVQFDGVNIISLVDHSEDVVRAAEQAALKVIREKGLVDLRTPPTTRNQDETDQPSTTA